MKPVLFLSFVLMLSFVGCQRDKMNSKNLTTVNVKRSLPASLPGNHVSLDTIKQNYSQDTNNTTITSNVKTLPSQQQTAKKQGTEQNIKKNEYQKLPHHRGQPSTGKSSRKRRDTTKSQRFPGCTDHYQRPTLSCQHRELHGQTRGHQTKRSTRHPTRTKRHLDHAPLIHDSYHGNSAINISGIHLGGGMAF